MTTVCLVGDPEVTLQYELLSRETARDALATYDIAEPFANSLAVETVSLGAAVSLLNDLNWYCARFVDEALVREPSVSREEWLSRDLATRIRDGAIRPAETDQRLKIYAVDEEDRLVDPVFAVREQGDSPTHQRADGGETVVVRVTEDEFEG
ncbi:DUF5804 family protein [Haloparvum sedimenti]|uniref:DUF5804 family protein n=1 Tax=Haloparvum sedimenti TaxID=1678448 RepID=UPI00071E9A0C|nr:DUF5804 family protein [Haloparvum sedimenti]